VSRLAGPARAVLEKFGIDINGAANGVYLPASRAIKSALDVDEAAHSVIHTDACYQAVSG